MKKCLYFFLGLMAALGLAVLSGMNTGNEKSPGLKTALGAAAANADGLAHETPHDTPVEFIPENKKP